ncbi:MAG TPA: right-handed parallel beta-helix repeat-containing protein [Blastocatellia bacterium]
MFHPGEQLGPYTLVRKIGRGNFGVVWLAERRTQFSTTQFALKLPIDDDVNLDTIRQEAEVWAKVGSHPNVLPLMYADVYDGQVVIVSQYAPDGSLAEWLKRYGGHAPSMRSAVEMADGIMAGLQHLHSQRIIHRDLKPRNILLQGETPRLADFGLARILQTSISSNIVAGTPAYMAPEAFRGHRSEKTDLWSAGVILYELVAGKLPYPQTDTESLAWAIINEKPEPLPTNLPPPMGHIIERALQKDPGRRFDSAAEMRESLRRLMQILGVEASTVRSIEPPTVRADNSDERTRRTVPEEVQQRVKQLVTEGARAFNAGQYQVAIDHWTEAHNLTPDDGSILERIEVAERKRDSLRRTQAVPPSMVMPSGGQGAQMQPSSSGSDSRGDFLNAPYLPGPSPHHQQIQQTEVFPVRPAPVRKRSGVLRWTLISTLILALGALAWAAVYFDWLKLKKELVVSKSSGGDYESISEAIRNARPGMRLLVNPGTYFESIVIDKNVELVGQTSLGTVVVESTGGACISMQAAGATVRGMTLRNKGGSLGKRFNAIDIGQGQLTVEDCDVSSDSIAAIAVHGSSANPTIRRTKIHDSPEQGVAFYSSAQGTMEDCEVFGNALAGIEIKESANPTIRGTKVHDGKGSALIVNSGGKGLIEDCEFFKSGLADVVITGGATVLRRTKIYGGKATGLRLASGSQATIENCEVYNNGTTGIEVAGDSSPVIRLTKVHHTTQSGMVFSTSAKGTIEDCDIYSTTAFGIEIKEQAKPTILKSRVYDGGSTGIKVYTGSSALFEGTTINNCKGAGWLIEGTGVVIRGCKVSNVTGDGIALLSFSSATIENCDVTNAFDGISIYDFATGTVKACKITGNRSHAFYLTTYAKGRIEDSDLVGNNAGAWGYNNTTFTTQVTADRNKY